MLRVGVVLGLEAVLGLRACPDWPKAIGPCDGLLEEHKDTAAADPKSTGTSATDSTGLIVRNWSLPVQNSEELIEKYYVEYKLKLVHGLIIFPSLT